MRAPTGFIALPLLLVAALGGCASPPPPFAHTYVIPKQLEQLDLDDPVGEQLATIWELLAQRRYEDAGRHLEMDLLPMVKPGSEGERKLVDLAAWVTLQVKDPEAWEWHGHYAERLEMLGGHPVRAGDAVTAAMLALHRARRGGTIPLDTPARLRHWLKGQDIAAKKE